MSICTSCESITSSYIASASTATAHIRSRTHQHTHWMLVTTIDTTPNTPWFSGIGSTTCCVTGNNVHGALKSRGGLGDLSSQHCCTVGILRVYAKEGYGIGRSQLPSLRTNTPHRGPQAMDQGGGRPNSCTHTRAHTLTHTPMRGYANRSCPDTTNLLIDVAVPASPVLLLSQTTHEGPQHV